MRLAALNAPYACPCPLATIADGVYCTDAYGRQRNILKDLGESIPWCLNDEKKRAARNSDTAIPFNQQSGTIT